MNKNLLFEVLVGSIKSELITDDSMLIEAKKGVLHAVKVASRLAHSLKKIVLITLLDKDWTGIIVIVNPFNREKVTLCTSGFGIITECNPTSLNWPVDEKVKIYLIDGDDRLYFGDVLAVK